MRHHPERTDAELDPRFGLPDGLGQHPDELIDVVAPPGILVLEERLAKLLPGKGVGEIDHIGLSVLVLGGYLVRIEIVVEVDTVHIVTADKFAHHLVGCTSHWPDVPGRSTSARHR